MVILKTVKRCFQTTHYKCRITLVKLTLLTALMLICSKVIVHQPRDFYFNFTLRENASLSWPFNAWKSLDIDNATVTPKITLKPNFIAMINATAPKYEIDTSYMMENPTLCSSVTNLTVLIIVHTAPKHFVHRRIIRQTWANNKCYINLGVVRILFLLGRVKEEKLQKRLEEEFKRNKDLLQGNFIDHYHNLTHKGVMAYKWITERCRNAKLILKTDDDVVVNMYLFLSKYAPTYISKGRHILCKPLIGGKVLRNRRSKWYVNENQFRNYTHFPTYCQGFMVMMTNDIIPDLYKSAKITPFFWIDDVFLYGLVPANVPKITYGALKLDREVKFVSKRAIACYANKTMTCDYVVVVGNYKLSKKVWGYMTQHQLFDRNSTWKLWRQRLKSACEY